MYNQIKAQVLLQSPFWMIICHTRICFVEFLIHETCLINNPIRLPYSNSPNNIIAGAISKDQFIAHGTMESDQNKPLLIWDYFHFHQIDTDSCLHSNTHSYSLNTNGPWILRISDEIECTRWNRTYINVPDFTCLHLKWIETSLDWMKDVKTQSKWNGITQIKWNTTVGITAALWLLYWWGGGNLILRFHHANLLQFCIYAKRTTLAYM